MSLKSNSVIIVDSPFQLLCGVELIKLKKLNEKGKVHLIGVNNKSVENMNQIKNLYKHFSNEFDSFKEIRIKNKYGILNFYYYLHIYSTIIQSVKELKINTIILGDFANGYFRNIANKFDDKRIILLDDGFGTLQIFNIDSWGLHDRKETFKRVLSFGSYNSKKKYVELFTVFEGIVNYKYTINNSFFFLRESMTNINKSDDSYIIGMPVVEDGILDKTIYMCYLEKIIESLENEKIIYIPHRREDDLKLNEISEKYGCKIVKLGMPIELFFCINKTIPKNIISFFSTSLYNLNKLLGTTTNITSIKINPSHILKRNTSIENVYSVLTSQVKIKEILND